MLITCGGCGAKMRAPETAAGKRVKCPKCATLISIPASDAVHEETPAAEPKPTRKPVPPPPLEDEEDEKTRITSSGSKPPPLEPKRNRSRRDEADEDDEEEDRPRRRRRRMDADEDDYLDVRSRRRNPANGPATTAMTLGVISLIMSTLGACCCGIFGDIIAIVCGGIAVPIGLSAKKQGGGSTATTGVICGGIGLALGIIFLILRIFIIGLNLAGGGNGPFNFNFPG